ncbi:MAG: hypothetical protein DRP84_02140 [Spirochaetes bacterium]|nr:MAG: hypothetical protein DRP84_02140 [Spirochaetota bacterium]
MKKTTFQKKIGLIVLGILILLALLEVGLRLGGYPVIREKIDRNKVAFSGEKDCCILCLGECIERYWPYHIGKILKTGKDLEIDFTVIDKGRNNCDTNIILSKLNDDLDTYNPDIVVVMMGKNDEGNTVKYNFYDNSIFFFNKFRIFKLTKYLLSNMRNKSKAVYSKYISNIAYAEETNVDLEDVNVTYDNEGEYIESANRYIVEGKYKDAIEILFNARKNYPAAGEIRNLFEICNHLQDYGEVLKKSPDYPGIFIKLAPYIFLKREDLEPDQFDRFNELFAQAMEAAPKKDEMFYAKMADIFRRYRHHDKAIEIWKKIISIKGNFVRWYFELAWEYVYEEKYNDAIEILKKAVDLFPECDEVYMLLGICYIDQERYSEAEKLLERARVMFPECSQIYNISSLLYNKQGKRKLSEKFHKKKEYLESKYYNPQTRHNYRKLRDIVLKKGIRLVCVQYPLRSASALKKMLEPLNPDNDIIFVSNEKNFQQAIINESYHEYFTSNSSGDFGHYSDKGNRLLAENIADVILKEVFGKNGHM